MGMVVIKRIFSVTAMTLVAALLLATPCMADEVQDGIYRLEPVTVSAQKREEDVQDVPLSVSTIDEMTLEESGIIELIELDEIVANFHLADIGGTGQSVFLGMRGRISTGADLTPTVAVLVDGVPYSDIYSAGSSLLFDVERIEVLRGPQSTMYGLNSIGGVINVITKQPTDTTIAKVYGEGTFGDKWDGAYMAGASISGPIKEGLLRGGLAVMGMSQGGYIKNTVTGERYNNDEKIGLKGNFNWTPTQALSVSGGLVYSNIDGDYGSIGLPFDEAAANKLGQDFRKWECSLDYEGYQKVENWAPNLNISYAFDSFQITTLSAYRNTAQEYGVDIDLSSSPIRYTEVERDSRSFTQELKIQSRPHVADNFEWMAGYFYSLSDQAHEIIFFMPGSPGMVVPIVDAHSIDQSHSLFGQGTYRFLDKKLGVTVGFRQEWTTQEVDEEVGYFDEASFSDSQLLPKVAVDYRLTPDHMVYASVTQGWRSGGINYMGAATTLNKFEKETCWSYELGAKTKWLDNRLLFNIAAFHVEYADYQDLLRTSFRGQSFSNAPKVTMTGFETDMVARLSTSLLLSGSFGYTNAQYVDFPDTGAGDFNGNKVLLVPDFDANLALQYTFLENFYVRPEVSFVGTIYWDRENTKKQSPYALLGARAGWARDNYEIYIFGENLTNKYAFTHANKVLGDENLYGNPIPPMRFGLGARWVF